MKKNEKIPRGKYNRFQINPNGEDCWEKNPKLRRMLMALIFCQVKGNPEKNIDEAIADIRICHGDYVFEHPVFLPEISVVQMMKTHVRTGLSNVTSEPVFILLK